MNNSSIDSIFNETTPFERSPIYTKKMETIGQTFNDVLDKNNKNQRTTENQHGVVTPGATPAVDDGRVEAEKARRAAELAENAPANGQNDPPPEGNDSEEDEEDEEKKEPTEEQIDAVQRVLKWKSTDYRNILGVQDKYDTPEVEQKEILDAFRVLGTLIHADHVKGKRTKTAYESK